MNNDNFQVFSCKGSLFERWKFLCIIYAMCRRENRNGLPLILLFVPMYAAYFLLLRPSQNRPFYIQACEWLSQRTLLKKDNTNLGVFWKLFLVVNNVIGSASLPCSSWKRSEFLKAFLPPPQPMCNGLLGQPFLTPLSEGSTNQGESDNDITLPKDKRLFHVRQWSNKQVWHGQENIENWCIFLFLLLFFFHIPLSPSELM